MDQRAVLNAGWDPGRGLPPMNPPPVAPQPIPFGFNVNTVLYTQRPPKAHKSKAHGGSGSATAAKPAPKPQAAEDQGDDLGEHTPINGSREARHPRLQRPLLGAAAQMFL